MAEDRSHRQDRGIAVWRCCHRAGCASRAPHVPSASQSEGKPLPSQLAGWHWYGACLGFASGALGSEERRKGWCPLVVVVCSDEHDEEL